MLIDGFQNLSALLGNVRPMEFGPLDWFGELQRIITDGRQLGIHVDPHHRPRARPCPRS